MNDVFAVERRTHPQRKVLHTVNLTKVYGFLKSLQGCTTEKLHGPKLILLGTRKASNIFTKSDLEHVGTNPAEFLLRKKKKIPQETLTRFLEARRASPKELCLRTLHSYVADIGSSSTDDVVIR